jgi:hypothetical protein
MELLSEWQTRHPNRLALPIVAIWIPSKSITTFFGFLPFIKCSLLGNFGEFQPPFSIVSFPLRLIIHLDHALVGTIISISHESIQLQRTLLEPILTKSLPIVQLQQVDLQLFFQPILPPQSH